MIPSNLETAIYALVVTPALHLADKSGMLTCLVKNGPTTGADIAGELGVDAETTERLLLVLAGADLVRLDADQRFYLDGDLRPYLDKADPHYIGGFVQHMVDGTPERLGILESYLDSGKQTVDASRPEPYEAFYRDEQATAEFMQAMWDLSYDASRELVPLAELSAARRLVDVGGACGPFAVAALQQLPDLSAVVFDLPNVRPYLERSRQEHDLGSRLDFVGGDFFVDDLPEGDVVALGYVMSNWPDAECVQILRRAHKACVPGGKALVLERLFDDDRCGPIATSVMNLTMHVETRGRHRTVAEYFELLAAAGFADCEVRRSSRDKHLLIGYKRE